MSKPMSERKTKGRKGKNPLACKDSSLLAWGRHLLSKRKKPRKG